MDDLTKRLKDSNDALQASLSEMQKALDAFFIGRGVITNPQTETDVKEAVAEANRQASRTAVRCGDSVQFYDFEGRD